MSWDKLVLSILTIFLWIPSVLAQSNPGFVEGAPLCANYPNPICQNTSPANPLSLNQAFMSKLDATTGSVILPNQLTTPATITASICSSTTCPDTTLPNNGLWMSGSGAIFTNCPLIGCLEGDHQRSAFYLKGTTTQDSSIAEYIMTVDCNLNSGKGGTPVGPGNFSDNKVCNFISTVTDSNSGGASWAQSIDFVLHAGDTGGFKVNTELDISNQGADCAIAIRNCYGLFISGQISNPVTAYVAITDGGQAGSGVGSHYALLFNGTRIADVADIDINDSSSLVAVCVGCLLATTHSQAGFKENSTTPVGMTFTGTYSISQINGHGFSIGPTGGATFTLPSGAGGGGLYVCVDSSGNFYKKATCP